METKEKANGVAKKTPQKKAVPATAKKEKGNPVVKMADETLKKMVEFQQVVDRVNELQKLVDNYGKVTDTLKSLHEFKGTSGESIQFILQDHSNDNSFMTYNTNLVTMVISILTTKLKEKQQELVDKILDFEV